MTHRVILRINVLGDVWRVALFPRSDPHLASDEGATWPEEHLIAIADDLSNAGTATAIGHELFHVFGAVFGHDVTRAAIRHEGDADDGPEEGTADFFGPIVGLAFLAMGFDKRRPSNGP